MEAPGSASLLVLDTFDATRYESALGPMHERLGGPASVVFAFVSPDWLDQLEEFLEVTQIVLRCPLVVGGTAGGLIGTSGEHEGVSGCSLLALRLPSAPPSIETWIGHPGGLARETPAPGTSAGAVLLANPLRLSVDSFLSEWNARHPRVTAYGGFVSGGADASSLALFTQDGLSMADCLAVHFPGDVQIDGALGQACRPIGPSYLVTGAEGNLLTSLEGLAPLHCLEETVREEGRRGRLDQLPEPGMLHAGFTEETPLTPSTSPAGDVYIRAIIGGDQNSGAVAIAGTPEIGQEMQFHLRDAAAASHLWSLALHSCKTRHPGLPMAGLLFPCAGRGSAFFQMPDHDVHLTTDILGAFPLSGFFANGELASPTATLQAHTFSVAGLFFYPVESSGT